MREEAVELMLFDDHHADVLAYSSEFESPRRKL